MQYKLSSSQPNPKTISCDVHISYEFNPNLDVQLKYLQLIIKENVKRSVVNKHYYYVFVAVNGHCLYWNVILKIVTPALSPQTQNDFVVQFLQMSELIVYKLECVLWIGVTALMGGLLPLKLRVQGN